ncbi:UNKNOWN [Stylonychia lemnae]|uniref:Uncharacterized protein n=1 Tax=Stylonychia lemnae TaxID=5949 RepID=A0A077ZZC3_STYLE|nr:UNKNOWN [Stylonychia lemnae]|eukprot:CDW74937.1 UNKNOWN [Stylonychia lemnae]
MKPASILLRNLSNNIIWIMSKMQKNQKIRKLKTKGDRSKSGAKHKSQKQKANNTNLKNKKKSNPKSKRKRQQLISETLGNNQTTINQINIEDLSHQDISNVQDISSNPSQLFDNFDGNTREETVSNSLKDKLAEIKQQNRGSFEENYQIYDYDFEDVKNRFKANHNIEIQSSARSRII